MFIIYHPDLNSYLSDENKVILKRARKKNSKNELKAKGEKFLKFTVKNSALVKFMLYWSITCYFLFIIVKFKSIRSMNAEMFITFNRFIISCISIIFSL